MPLFRCSLMFKVATSPVDLTIATPRTGGWSEGVWFQGLQGDAVTRIKQLAVLRAILLPTTAAINGYRVQEYTIAGSSLIAGGVSAGRLTQPGVSGQRTDLPQVSLDVFFSSGNQANTRRGVLAGMPDSVMVGGEFQPDGPYLFALRVYLGAVSGGLWCFPGRNLALGSTRIQSIVNGVITTDGNHGIAANTYARILRCRDDFGGLVRGRYFVTAATGNTLTVAGLGNGVVVHNSGFVRADGIVIAGINGYTIGRAVVRKVGKPSDQFRGRRSATR